MSWQNEVVIKEIIFFVKRESVVEVFEGGLKFGILSLWNLCPHLWNRLLFFRVICYLTISLGLVLTASGNVFLRAETCICLFLPLRKELTNVCCQVL